jgi:hypothetical protein
MSTQIEQALLRIEKLKSDIKSLSIDIFRIREQDPNLKDQRNLAATIEKQDQIKENENSIISLMDEASLFYAIWKIENGQPSTIGKEKRFSDPEKADQEKSMSFPYDRSYGIFLTSENKGEYTAYS